LADGFLCGLAGAIRAYLGTDDPAAVYDFAGFGAHGPLHRQPAGQAIRWGSGRKTFDTPAFGQCPKERISRLDTDAKVSQDEGDLAGGADNAWQLGGVAETADRGTGMLGLQRDRLRGRGAAERAGAADIPTTMLEM
jgi:hypothetical protein